MDLPQDKQQEQIVFPSYDVGIEAAKEKKGRSSVFTMHFWWARKPLVATRAALLSLLLPATEFNGRKTKQWLGLSEKNRAYKHDLLKDIPKLQKLYKKRTGKTQPTLLDPFGGGGSISYEALRLGINAISNDYNPIAYNIQLATLKYPKLYGDILVDRMEEAFESLETRLADELVKNYPTNHNIEPQTYMYAWLVICPYCGFKTPVVNNWVLKKKPIRKSKLLDWTYLVPSLRMSKVEIEIVNEKSKRPTKLLEGNCIRGNAECLKCNNIILNEDVLDSIKNNEEEQLLCIVGGKEGESGKIYYLPTNHDLKIFNEFTKIEKQVNEEFVPQEKMPLRVIASARYLEYWKRLLNPRQRLLYAKYVEIGLQIANQYQERFGEPWGKIVSTYFALLLGKSVDFNNRGSSWATKEGVRNSLAFRRPSMAWNHIEINPFAHAGSGTFSSLRKNVMDGIKVAVNTLFPTPGTIEIHFKSVFALNLEKKADIILTDPPYGDDVQYSELSEFFYVWERKLLQPYYEELPDKVPTDEDLSVNNMDRKREYVSFGLALAFSRINEFLRDEGQFALFFAHGKYDTWAFVIDAIRDGKFQINATFPVHTESKDNVIALGKASFMTSVLIYSTKRLEEGTVAYIEDLKDIIVKKIRESVPMYLKFGLKESDLSMVALGPALQVLTQYSEIKSISGSINFEQILDITQKPLLEEILGGTAVQNLDGPTKFYLYTRVSNIREIDHDSLQLLSKSFGFLLEELHNSNIISSKVKSKTKHYTISNFKRDIPKKRTTYLIDLTHHLMRLYQNAEISKSDFWKHISKSKFDTGDVRHALDVLRIGIQTTKRVSTTLDMEARIANELL